jgi:hypothetical protein
VNELITSGLDSIGLRCPNHPLTLELITSTGLPLAAPSANKFSRTSPTSKQHVYEEFGDSVYVLDGGPCVVGIESTVVGVFEHQILIYRPGMIGASAIRQALSDYEIDVLYAQSPVSPGALKHHYMPTKPLTLTCKAPQANNISSWTVPDSAELAARMLYSQLRAMDGQDTDEIHIVLKPEFKTQESFKGLLNRLDKAKTTDHYFG